MPLNAPARLMTLAAAVVVAASITAAYAIGAAARQQPASLAAARAAPPRTPERLEPPVALPDVMLERADGGAFSTAELRDHQSLFFFGYTHCPEVCPPTLSQVAQLRQQLGPLAATLDAYFVTVDPERDTAAWLSQYTAQFDPAIVGLTGGHAAIEQLATAFGAEIEPIDDDGAPGDHDVAHSAALYYVDATGRYHTAYPFRTEPAAVLADLRQLLEHAPPARASAPPPH